MAGWNFWEWQSPEEERDLRALDFERTAKESVQKADANLWARDAGQLLEQSRSQAGDMIGNMLGSVRSAVVEAPRQVADATRQAADTGAQAADEFGTWAAQRLGDVRAKVPGYAQEIDSGSKSPEPEVAAKDSGSSLLDAMNEPAAPAKVTYQPEILQPTPTDVPFPPDTTVTRDDYRKEWRPQLYQETPNAVPPWNSKDRGTPNPQLAVLDEALRQSTERAGGSPANPNPNQSRYAGMFTDAGLYGGNNTAATPNEIGVNPRDHLVGVMRDYWKSNGGAEPDTGSGLSAIARTLAETVEHEVAHDTSPDHDAAQAAVTKRLGQVEGPAIYQTIYDALVKMRADGSLQRVVETAKSGNSPNPNEIALDQRTAGGLKPIAPRETGDPGSPLLDALGDLGNPDQPSGLSAPPTPSATPTFDDRGLAGQASDAATGASQALGSLADAPGAADRAQAISQALADELGEVPHKIAAPFIQLAADIGSRWEEIGTKTGRTAEFDAVMGVVNQMDDLVEEYQRRREAGDEEGAAAIQQQLIPLGEDAQAKLNHLVPTVLSGTQETLAQAGEELLKRVSAGREGLLSIRNPLAGTPLGNALGVDPAARIGAADVFSQVGKVGTVAGNVSLVGDFVNHPLETAVLLGLFHGAGKGIGAAGRAIARSPVARSVAGAAGGALAGYQTGDTEEERRRNAALGAGAGFALGRVGPGAIGRAAGRLRDVTDSMTTGLPGGAPAPGLLAGPRGEVDLARGGLPGTPPTRATRLPAWSRKLPKGADDYSGLQSVEVGGKTLPVSFRQTKDGRVLREWNTADTAQVAAQVPYIPDSRAAELLGQYPDYLDGVVKHIIDQREKVRTRGFTARDVAKAYVMTINSQGQGAVSRDVAERALGMEIPDLYVDGGKVRPEEGTAAWLFSEQGQRALDNIERGVFNIEDWAPIRKFRSALGDDRWATLNVDGLVRPRKGFTGQMVESPIKRDKAGNPTQFNLTNIPELVDALNATGGDPGLVRQVTRKMNGIAAGKLGFINHFLGFGDRTTVDAVEINGWLSGRADLAASGPSQTATGVIAEQLKKGMKKDAVGDIVTQRITESFQRLQQQGYGTDLDPRVAQHVMHHWFWDRLKGLETTHQGLYHAMRNALVDDGGGVRTISGQLGPRAVGGAIAGGYSAAQEDDATPGSIAAGAAAGAGQAAIGGSLTRRAMSPGALRSVVENSGRRLFHGTTHAYDTTDPALLASNEPGLKGPGLYLAEHPDVADRYAQASPRGDAGGGAPNVRPVTVPSSLNILNDDETMPVKDVRRVLKAARSLAPDDVDGIRDEIPFPNNTSGGGLWSALYLGTGHDRVKANQILAAAGYDGINFDSTSAVPITGASGDQVTHRSTVIFPESTPKLVNSLTGRPEADARAAPAAVVAGADDARAHLSPVARDVVETYDRVTPERATNAREQALAYANAEIVSAVKKPVPGIGQLMEQVYDAMERNLKTSKVVATGLRKDALVALLQGRGITTKADAGDLAAITKITQQQVNVAGGRAKLNPETGKMESAPYTLDDAGNFIQRESLQNRMALGGSRFPTPDGQVDADAPRHAYAYVTDGQPLIGPNAPDVWVIWKPGTPRVTSAHHPYALGSPDHDIHASMPPGLKMALWADGSVHGARRVPGPGGEPIIEGWEDRAIPLAGGRKMASTNYLVGPDGEDTMRAAGLLLSIPSHIQREIARGKMTDPEQIAAALQRGGAMRAGPYRGASAVISRNRSESLLVDPTLHNVQAIYIAGPAATLRRDVEKVGRAAGIGKGGLTVEETAKAVRRKILEETGNDVPVLWVETGNGRVPRMSEAVVLDGSPLPEPLAPGRAHIVDQYTQAIDPMTKKPYTNIGQARVDFAVDLGGAAGGAAAGYQTGDTEEERLRNAALGGVAGLALGRGAARAIGRDMSRDSAEGVSSGIVPTNVARKLGRVAVNASDAAGAMGEAVRAVGGRILPDGISIDLRRFQKPEQPGNRASRGGVFYAAKNEADSIGYAGTDDLSPSPGGPQEITGATILRRPLVAEGFIENDGRLYEQLGIPSQPYNLLHEIIDARHAQGPSGSTPRQRLEALVEKYGGDPSIVSDAMRHQAWDELPSTLRENIITSAARRKGYDSIIGISDPKRVGHDGQPSIIEIADLREGAYPGPNGEYTLRPEYDQQLRDEADRLSTGRSSTPGRGAGLGVVESDRYYHGTGKAFDTPGPDTFAEDGLYGPGYYLTDDPRVAGSGNPLRPGYAEAKSNTLDAPNVRAVDAPRDLNLFDAEGDVTPELRAALKQGALDAGYPRLAESAGLGMGAYDAGDLYEILTARAGSKSTANEILAAAGYDGIKYDGGVRRPMRDGAGNPIEHQAVVIFGESLDKLTNATSGRMGGLAPTAPADLPTGDFLQRGAVGGIAGAYAESQQEDATPESIARGAAAGIGGAAVRGEVQRELRTRLAQAAKTQATSAFGAAAPGISAALVAQPQQQGKNAADWALAWARTVGYSALLGPSAAVAGVGGNLVHGIIQYPKHFAMLTRDLGGNPHLVTQLGALTDGVFAAGADLLRTLALGSQTGWNAQQHGNLLSNELSNPILKPIAALMEYPGKVATGIPDVVFGNLANEWGLAATAMRQAKAKGLSGQAFDQEVRQLIQDARGLQKGQGVGVKSQDAQDVADAAGAFKKYMTFQNDLSPLADRVNKLRTHRSGNQAVDLVWGLFAHLVMPFFPTLANSAARTLELTPAGLTRGDIEPSGLTGKKLSMGEKTYDSAVGLLIGAGLVEYALTQGGITGSGPTDPSGRRQERADGRVNNAFRVGQFWVPNSAAGHLAPLLNAAGEVADMIRYDKADGLPEALNKLSSRLGKVGTDVFFLRGLGDLIEYASSADRDTATGLAQLPARFLPLGATLRTAALATDPLNRQVRKVEEVGMETAAADALNISIPGRRQQLPTTRDVLGRPEPNPRTGASAVLPVRVPRDPSPVLAEYRRLGVNFPQVSADKIGAQTLTPAQKRQYRETAQPLRARLVEQVISSRVYQAADDKNKARLLEGATNRAAAWAAQAIVPRQGEDGYEFLTRGVNRNPDTAAAGYVQALALNEQLRAAQANRYVGAKGANVEQLASDVRELSAFRQALGKGDGEEAFIRKVGTRRFIAADDAEVDPRYEDIRERVTEDPKWKLYFGPRAVVGAGV